LLYEIVAEYASRWNESGNVGLVVGATYPNELKEIRERYPRMPLLIPGVGAQGGDLELTIRHGADGNGERTIINSSRQVIYASRGGDFAGAARQAAKTLRDRINQILATAKPVADAG
jgi:orotidine-5'-phosphate decarboxylase